MNLENLVNGIKSGTIKLLNEDHRVNQISERLEHHFEHFKSFIQKYKAEGKETKGHEEDLNKELLGTFVRNLDLYCFDCGKTLYIFCLDENTIALESQYQLSWEQLTHFNAELVQPCACSDLKQKGKLETSIQVPTGEFVFQNYFTTNCLYDYTDDRQYREPSINSVLGQYKLAQHLAELNVGYGQTGNCSLDIYANDREILVTRTCIGELGNDDKKEDALLEYLKTNKLERKGEVSCSVWRWQCMDLSLLAEHGEQPTAIYDEKPVIFNTKSGKWHIEHYNPFVKDYPLVYSRMYLDGLSGINSDFFN